MPKGKHTTVKLAPETYRAVKAYCAGRGLKLGWVLSQAVREYLDAQKAKS